MTTRKSFTKNLTATFAGAALALAGSSPAFAEDIDIFTAGTGNASKPNVLIMLDNSSNWSSTLGANACNSGNTATNTKFGAEICALQKVVDALPAEMRLGLMLFNESGNNGGYIRFGIRDLTGANKQAYKDLLANMVSNGTGTDASGSNQPYTKALFEAFKYFGGGTGTPQDSTHFGPISYQGGAANNAGTYRRDYNGNNSGGANQANGNRAAAKYNADANYAFASSASNTYTNPIVDNCAKNFVIIISNGNPSTGGDTGADTLLNNIGGDATQRIKVGNTEIHASLLDEMAKYLNGIDASGNAGVQTLIVYTISVYAPQNNGSISNTDSQMIKLMNSTAINGGGKPFTATSAQAIVDALLNILNEVQAVNSVFVSASLPVSVNTQGTFLNQVYMGLFRPEGSGSPRWVGNVKEYKFVQNAVTGALKLADSTGALAVNPSTGFISPTAVSYWTTNSQYWARFKQGIPKTGDDKPDGDVVQKGGASQVLRNANLVTQDTRKMFTCPDAAGCPATFPYPGMPFTGSQALKNANITLATHGAAFGASNATDLSLLVNWIRGQDNAINTALAPLNSGMAPCDPAGCTWDSAESGPGWTTTVRPSIHGDVLHSRPVVLNYRANSANASNALGPHMIYAANDGVLRITKGGTAATDGAELWSFVAPEFFGKFRRLRYAAPELRTPGTPSGLIASTLPKDYFFDGPIGVYEETVGGVDSKYIFVAARRGGSLIYAFNVSDPAAPRLMWKHDGTSLDQLGQAWSLPVAFRMQGATDPFLVFGAGYDPGDDSTPPVSTGKGRGIYVLNAKTGAKLRFIQAGSSGNSIANPIPSDMGFLATFHADGTVGDYYRGYVGDTGGNVWRLDIQGPDQDLWQLHKFAALGAGYKILYAPDLVKAGDKDVVLVGSGDREKPLLQTGVDRFWGLYDKKPNAALQATLPLVIQSTNLEQISQGGAFSGDVTKNGWFFEMAVGEKVVNSPLTVAGFTYFATNKPTPPAVGSCDSNLGEARQYQVGFLTGAPSQGSSISTVLVGGGLAPSPVGGVVDLGKPDGTEGGDTVAFCIGCDPKQRLDPTRPNIVVPTNRQKIYWNMKLDS
jgi:type IV pilus assembly protein PilY1